MTGVDFTNLFNLKTDGAYSQYYDPTVQLPLLFKEGLIEAIEKKYNRRADQKDYDDISSLIKTSVVFGINNNQIYTSALNISNITYVGSTVTITTSLPHNLIVGQLSIISGATGVTNVNGTFTVLTTPTSNTFTYLALIAPAGAYITNSANLIYANMIFDYNHILAIKAKFLDQFVGLSITKATNATPIRITLSGSNNIRSKQIVNISGILGNTASNGQFYVNKINSNTMDLYTNWNLTVPVSGNGVYTSGGTISNVLYKYCTPYYSERKIAHLTDPKMDRPKYEDANNSLKIYPVYQPCQEITVDYVANPNIFIDPLDDELDLELYYPLDFLLFVVDVCKDVFFSNTKDFESVQKSQLDIKDNF